MAGEFRDRVAFNALWPRTVIGTAAVQNLLGGDSTMQRTRSPQIMADAAHRILTAPTSFSGNFCIDEDLLRQHGQTDFSMYSPAGAELIPDVFL
jgi:citronellol/citronellal dehydrogenase